MDARGAAAARAVSLVVSDANTTAVRANVQLRRVVGRAMAAVERGDRALALRLLAVALNNPVPVVPGTRGHWCVLCGARRRSVVVMTATGRWAQLPAVQRMLCTPCFRLQPPQ